MSAYIIDTETTGEEPVPEVIELAIAELSPSLEYLPRVFGRFKPERPITFRAMSVHHILPEELEGEPSSALAAAQIPTDAEYLIGHNVDYDWQALGSPNIKRICTLAMARWLWPEASHTLSALAYMLATNLKEARELLQSAHSAAADIELCYNVLRVILGDEKVNARLNSFVPAGQALTFEHLWQFSEDCRIPRIWTFGKHKGSPVAGTDPGYLLWCQRQDDMDPYVKLACRMALKGQLT